MQETPETAYRSEEQRSKHARAGVAMAVATFAVALTSGLQALMYLRSFGADGRTDGFFAALGLYAIFGLFGQAIRVTSVPLLVGDKPRLGVGEFAAALVVIGAPVLIVTIGFSDQLAHVLAPGLSDADRAVTRDALPVLGVAMVLQLWAAGAATLLAVRDRFSVVAAAFIAGGATALVTYVAIEGTADELSLGISMLAMAVVTLTVMVSGLVSGVPSRADVRRFAGTLRLRAVPANVGTILGRNAVYLVFNGLYIVTLAFTSRFASGDATVLAYVYMLVSYLVAGTGFALGMSRVPDMTRGARTSWREVVADTVAPGFRYTMMLSAPVVAAFVVVGAPLAGDLFSASLGTGDADSMRRFGLLLAAWVVAAQLVNLLLPAMFAIGRARLVNVLALPLLVLHIALSAIAGNMYGVNGVIGVFFVAPMAFAIVLVWVAAGESRGRLALELTGDALRFGALAAVSYAVGNAVGSLLDGAIAHALVAGLIGTGLYGLGIAFAAKRQVSFLLGALRPVAGRGRAAVSRASASG